MAEFTPVERDAFNSDVDARIDAAVDNANFGAALAAEGITTVALDDSGVLCRYLPDGSSETLSHTP